MPEGPNPFAWQFYLEAVSLKVLQAIDELVALEPPVEAESDPRDRRGASLAWNQPANAAAYRQVQHGRLRRPPGCALKYRAWSER